MAFSRSATASKNTSPRNGQFTVGANGELVAQGSGMRVLSNAGSPIPIPPESVRMEIGTDGMLTSVGNDGERTQIARIALVQPASENQLQKIGNSLYRTQGSVAPAGGDLQVKQGYLEGSGVSRSERNGGDDPSITGR